MLAEDLANLPQFLGQADDLVLLTKQPSPGFLDSLYQAGFPRTEFIELREGRIDPDERVYQRQFGSLRPWAWGPDSVELLEPLFGRVIGEARSAGQYFNDKIAQLYSKAWSADFLRKVLGRDRSGSEIPCSDASEQTRAGKGTPEPWLCSEAEAGVAVDTVENAFKAIAAIRGRGHHRVVVKEALGWAGQNTIRLWESEISRSQHQWLARAVDDGQQLVVEPWLERETDFSVQLEMGPQGLALCGYTGLVNDRKGQFQANWAEADYAGTLPAKVSALLGAPGGKTDITVQVQRLYGEIFSLLETELLRVGFSGPIGIDALVYRTRGGGGRLKPVVEINPRYTMGRLTLELMKYTGSGSSGLFRLVSQGQARAEGFADLSCYARSLGQRLPLCLEGEPAPRIHRGALCLNDPGQARVCLATFEVGPSLNLPGVVTGMEHHDSP